MEASIQVNRTGGYTVYDLSVHQISTEHCTMAHVEAIPRDEEMGKFSFSISMGDWLRLSRDISSALIYEED